MPDLTIPDLQAQAERMFEAVAELRLLDAERGRDSDVFFGRCHTLGELGLIDRARVLALDIEVTVRIKAYFGARHAA